ncbi:alpha-2-macroglobulin-like protein 1, partial [Pelobates fuscus]|uniref:alpha-2-macroglobulin-like protein 1 n=1 Tax=Pelobates fuscus TaxID=191477 RepID=UPI002FE4CBFA
MLGNPLHPQKLQVENTRQFEDQLVSLRDQLEYMPEVKKVSTTPNSVTIYLEKLTNMVQTYAINIVQIFMVMNLKPAVVKVFDYYFPEENSVTSYTMNSSCSYTFFSLGTFTNYKTYGLDGAVYYVTLIPAELHFPSTDQVCLHLETDKPNNLTIQVTVTLEVKGNVIELFTGTNPTTSPLQCYNFKVGMEVDMFGTIAEVDGDLASFEIFLNDWPGVPPPDGGLEEVATVRIVGKGDAQFSQSKYVLIRRISNGVVVQTDKPTYRPSQTVLFRILTLNEKFFTAKNQYHVVELKDSKSNRIAQWLDIKTNSGIVDLSFDLTSEPLLGTYTINVDNGQTLKTFIVQEEVLPRFEVTIEKPVEIYVLDSLFELKVCSRYTYGKGVSGSVEVRMCYSTYRQPDDICITSEGQTDLNGCFSTTVETQFFSLSEFAYYNYKSIKIIAVVEEVGTGVKISSDKQIPIAFNAGTLKFQDMDTYYKVGHPYSITLVVLNRDGSAVKFFIASLQISFGTETVIMEGQTNDMGQIVFILDTSKWTGSVSLTGFYKTLYATYGIPKSPFYNPVYQTVYPYYSEAQSFLRMDPIFSVILCDKRVNIKVTYELSLRDLSQDSKSVQFTYIIIGRTGILVSGQRSIILTKTNPVKGAFYLPIIFTSDFGPAPKMIGYILLNNGTMTADRLRFTTETCFPNKVNLKFPVREALPKTLLNLHMEASADSVCGLRVVDKSVQISYTDQELTADKVYSLFQFSDRSGYDSRIDEINSLPCMRRYSWTVDGMLNGNTQFTDILSLFRDVGVKILTNAFIQKPPERTMCPLLQFKLPVLMAQEVLAVDAPQIKFDSIPAPENNVREDFPETWLWKLMVIGKMGKADLNVTVPDTITDWSAGIFCTGPSGFGLSAPAYVRAFQPFFVEMSLPYSVVLGELFNLKASVFNYLDDCIKVQVSIPISQDLKVDTCPTCQYSRCVCSNRSIIFSWNVTVKAIGLVTLTVKAEVVNSTELCEGKKIIKPANGNIDIEKRQLLVKPGGIRKEKSQSFFYCLKGSSEKILGSFSLLLLDVVVENSVNAYIYVMGDLLGSSLQNLNNLLQMPYGCGEQNMLTTSTIVYVLQYLEATGQLTPEVRSQATSYLQSGYQRELNYKHSDGSYSAFGESDGEGSTWLTAFVVKCFSQGKLYIFIDEDLINKAVTWLGTLQQNDGCFKSVGRVIHTLMKGGVEDDVSLSGYITAALLEMGIPQNNIILANALNCIRNKVPNLTNPYTQALLAYAFTLANDLAKRAILLNKLYQVANLSDDETHWEYKLQSSGSRGGASASVELSSYILLALVSGSDVTTEDIEKASRIVRWLIKQQNPSGGFSSTQDTVVAIQALAKYLRVTFTDQMNVLVNVSDKKGFQKRFQVNSQNRLLQQSETLPHVPGEYSLIVTGYGCVYIKSVLKYNVYPKTSRSTFDL